MAIFQDFILFVLPSQISSRECEFSLFRLVERKALAPWFYILFNSLFNTFLLLFFFFDESKSLKDNADPCERVWNSYLLNPPSLPGGLSRS